MVRSSWGTKAIHFPNRDYAQSPDAALAPDSRTANRIDDVLKAVVLDSSAGTHACFGRNRPGAQFNIGSGRLRAISIRRPGRPGDYLPRGKTGSDPARSRAR